MHLDWIKLLCFKNLASVKEKTNCDSIEKRDFENHIILKDYSMERERSYIQFAVLCSSIYVVYLLNALVEEKIFKTTFKTSSNSPYMFKESSIFILLQSFSCYIVAIIMMNRKLNKNEEVLLGHERIKLSLLNLFSLLTSLSALKYISFPIQTLMKSSKILSVMLVSVLIGGKKYTKLEYLCALCISIGIILFNLLGSTEKNNENSSSILGILLLLASLFCDGLLVETQNQIRDSKSINPFDMMRATNSYGFIFGLIYSILSKEILFFASLSECDKSLIYLIVIGVALGVIGQVIVYYIISLFGPVVLTIVTTSRKFFTVLISIIIFDHSLNILQWMSVVFIFTGIGMETLNKLYFRKKNEEKKRFV